MSCTDCLEICCGHYGEFRCGCMSERCRECWPRCRRQQSPDFDRLGSLEGDSDPPLNKDES